MRTLLLLTVIASLAACSSRGPLLPETRTEWSTRRDSSAERDRAFQQIELPDPPDQQSAEQLRQSALALLRAAADSTNPLLRANAIEALHPVPSHLEPVVQLSLGDENEGVRFVAAMTVGQEKLCSLADLVTPLLDDPSPSVQAAAILALRRCDRDVSLSPLGAMIMSSSPTERANAALVLGELGDPSAIPMLREALHQPMPRVNVARAKLVDLQIAEAMVKLGADNELQGIWAALFAPVEEGELAVLAAQMLGELNDRSYEASLAEMARRTGRAQKPAELRLAATQALARLEPSRAPVEVPMSYLGSDRHEVRHQAAVTLGWFRNPSLLPVLSTMMRDTNASVQVAAAGGILRTLEALESARAEWGYP